MTPIRFRRTVRPLAALLLAATFMGAGAMPLADSAHAAVAVPPVTLELTPATPERTQVPPPSGPQAPPARRSTPPPAVPPVVEDDLPEGLRVRPVPPMRRVTGGPGIHFEVLDHHFGKMTNAETQHTTFAFINTGDQPLVISDVVAACACTRTSFERDPIAPGERGTIDVAFTPPTGGHQAKSMTIISNAIPANALVRIRVIGDVEAVLSFEPKVHDIGELELGKPYSGTFQLVADAATTYFDNVTARGRDFAISFVGDAPQQGTATMTVAFPGTLPWGRITTGAAIIATRGTTDEQTITKNLPLRVVGVVVDDIRADEYVIQFGFVSPGGTFEGESRVYHKDGKPFELVDVTMDPMDPTMRGVADAEYRVDVRPSTDPEKPGLIVRVRGQSRGPQGFLSGNIKFRARIDGAAYGGERTLGINGRVAPPERQVPATPGGR